MKKLSIEEKAKRYDEAIKKAKSLYKASEPMSGCNVLLETVFTELKESEDERIRKELISFFTERAKYTEDSTFNGLSSKEIIAWLEKQGETSLVLSNSSNIGKDAWSEEEQNRFAKGVLTSCAMSFIDYLDAHKYEGKMCVSNGECEDIENAFHNAMWDRLHRYYCKYIEKQGEQKSADKVEPKFKVGNFIINDFSMGRIVEITNDAYLLDTGLGIPFSCHSTRLWDVTKDAKDGDVLVASDKSIFIYNGVITKSGSANFYVACTSDGNITFGGDDDCGWEEKDSCQPATKEQRNLLFQKMKEAGYVWDAEKKELKKIEQKPVFEMKTPEESLGIDSDTYNKIVDDCIYGEQKSAEWSEEDETIKNNISHIIRQYDKISKRENQPCWYVGDCLLWMQNIKDRVQPQPKHEWSEEDEEMLNLIICDIESLKEQVYCKTLCNEEIDWLKSLKDRYTWKPSNEQIKALSDALSLAKNCGEEYSFDLRTLYEQLKKSKE